MEESEVKKYILNLAGEIPFSLKEYMSELGFEFIEDGESSPISFIFVKDLIDFDELKSKYKTVHNNIPIISLSEILNKKDFFNANGRAWLDSSSLNSEVAKIFLKRILSKKSTLRVETSFGDLLSDVKLMKMSLSPSRFSGNVLKRPFLP